MSEAPPALKTQIPPLIPRGPDWIDKPGVGAESFLGNFVDSAHVILMLPTLGFPFENYWIMVTDSQVLMEIGILVTCQTWSGLF